MENRLSPGWTCAFQELTQFKIKLLLLEQKLLQQLLQQLQNQQLLQQQPLNQQPLKQQLLIQIPARQMRPSQKRRK
jgi:hypothetical protein